MYSVSNAYLTAMRQPVQQYNLYGTIDSVNFNTSNILSGSFQITNQCCDTNKLELGGVFIGELDCTFMNVNIARGSWIGKTITPYCGLWTGSAYEYVPLGIYTISEATWNSDQTVDVVAYDNMEKFDKSIAETSTHGTPYTLASLACSTCGVTLGTTENEFSNFVNGDETLTLYTENNDLDTWRDFLYWLAQSIGCFCTIDRSGNLVFRTFNQTIVETISNNRRYEGFDFSEYVTSYSGISVTNMSDDTTSYYSINEDDDDEDETGLVMNLGENPFLQIADQTTRDLQRRNILDTIELIEYAPFKGRINPNPIFDLGDVIKLTDGYGDNNLHCIMQYTFSYNRQMMLQGWGDNPALASAKSKTDKNISGLKSKVNSGGSSTEDKMKYYYYTNSSKVIADDGIKKEIVRMYYSVVRSTYAVAHIEIRCKTLYTETNQNTGSNSIVFPLTKLKFSYKVNGEDQTVYPRETLIDGYHVIHLLYPMHPDSLGLNFLQVFVESEDGRLTLEMNDLDLVLYGEGLEGDAAFSGLITINESFNEVTPGNPNVVDFDDTCTHTIRNNNSSSVTDTFTSITPANLTITGSWTETIAPRIPRQTYTISTANKLKYTYDNTKVLTNNDEFSLVSDIQSSTIISDAFNLYNALITGIESVTVQYSGTPTISVSTDGGTIWKAFNGNQWVVLTGNEGMQISTFIAITLEQWTLLTQNRGTLTTKINLHSGDTLKSILYDFTN